eukprot:TRINITY_DN2483_c0_g1_i1.p1 TRINITY_DN2483_c0_g1~~TRINITY_DN2483_c0_g1_i1.p1  ORF type:complete len:381 (+),score=73.13 TRINITY_DN2483_c0_g1_i1:125-1144(+)
MVLLDATMTVGEAIRLILEKANLPPTTRAALSKTLSDTDRIPLPIEFPETETLRGVGLLPNDVIYLHRPGECGSLMMRDFAAAALQRHLEKAQKPSGSFRDMMRSGTRSTSGSVSGLSSPGMLSPTMSTMNIRIGSDHLQGAEWDRVRRAVIQIISAGTLPEPMDTLTGLVQGLVDTTATALLVSALFELVCEGLLQYQKILAEAKIDDFLHKLHIRWQSYRSSITTYIQGVFLALHVKLSRTFTRSALDVRDMCLVAFRDTVLLNDKVIEKFEVIVAREEVLAQWLLSMSVEIAMPTTRDENDKRFRMIYMAPVERSIAQRLAAEMKEIESQQGTVVF